MACLLMYTQRAGHIIKEQRQNRSPRTACLRSKFGPISGGTVPSVSRHVQLSVRPQAAGTVGSLEGSLCWPERRAHMQPWFDVLGLLCPIVAPVGALVGSLALLGVVPIAQPVINWVLLSPLVLLLMVSPVVDLIVGDGAGMLEQEMADMDKTVVQRSYQRASLFAIVQAAAVFTAPAAAAAAWAAQGAASLGTLAALVSCSMLICACAHGANHELLHSRNNALHQALANLLFAWELAWPYTRVHPYHHLHVCTPQDFTTARLNQSFYDYLPMYVSQNYAVAWQLEAAEAQRKGRPVWSWSNAMIRGMAIQVGILAWSFISGGVPGLLVHVCSACLGLCYLAVGDYFLHYGLTRVRMPDGSWSPVTRHNAFNSSFILDNMLTFHVMSHSAHHVVGSKPSIALGFTSTDLQRTAELRAAGHTGYEEAVSGQDGDRAPRLLPGVPLTAAVNLAFIPPLWFKYVNPLSEAANKAHRIAVGVEQPAA